MVQGSIAGSCGSGMMKRKGYIAERDVNQLLKRYETSTILSLLYEVSRCSGARVDWNELVKETNTGIKNPREYQALWRHLAYRKELDPDGEELPLEDDDSDLEFELEPSPVVAPDAASEATNYVKALMGFSTDVVFANADVPGLGLSSVLPGFTNAQAASLEAFYKANSVSQAEKKKRRIWGPQEDDELTAAVEKYGEGNWAAMAKLVFKQERTAPQLAQRWAIVKKRREVAGSFPVKQPQVEFEAFKRTTKATTTTLTTLESEQNQNGSFMQSSLLKQGGQIQVSPAQKTNVPAQRKTAVPTIPRAANPMAPLITTGAQAKPLAKPAIVPLLTPVNVQKPAATSAAAAAGSPALSVQLPAQTPGLTLSSPRPGKAGNSTTTGTTTRVPSGNGGSTRSGPDPMVQAAAVAAGARIAPASAAATFMKAKNVVHVRPPSIAKPNKNRGSPVVHYIRTGSGAPPPLLQSLSGKRGGKLGVKATNKLTGVKPGGAVAASAMSRLALNSIKEEAAAVAAEVKAAAGVASALASASASASVAAEASKRKAVAAPVMHCQISSWYEDDIAAFDASLDSEPEDQTPVSAGVMVCTSSNESFSQSASAFATNGASPPLSQSSGQSD